MIVGNHLLSSRAIVITEVDKVKLGVCEVDPLGGDVQRKTIGPVDLGGDDGLPAGPVHTDPLDPGILSPVQFVQTKRNDGTYQGSINDKLRKPLR